MPTHPTRRRPRPPATLAAVLAATLLADRPATATTTFRISLPRAVRSADLVVEGKVRGFEYRPAVPAGAQPGPRLTGLHVTDVKLAVDQVYKGHLASRTLRVRVLGGTRDRRVLRDAFLPFRTGERVLLMLWHDGDDAFPLVGFHQGFYRIRPSGPGGTMPDVDATPRRCSTCTDIVLDGRSHPVTGILPDGDVATFDAAMHPAFRIFIPPHTAESPPEVPRPPGGVLPAGMSLPAQRLTPEALREAVWKAVAALGLPRDVPRLGDPSAPLVPTPQPTRLVVLAADDDVTHRHDAEDVPVADPLPDVPAVPGPQE